MEVNGMNKKVGIIIGGILLILAIIAAVFLLKGNKDTTNDVDNSNTNSIDIDKQASDMAEGLEDYAGGMTKEEIEDVLKQVSE